jgi:hypothetical protein
VCLLPYIPPEHPDSLQNIQNLIDVALSKLSPRILVHQRIEEITQKLKWYLLKGWLDNEVLCMLSQVICAIDQFVDVDSKGLEIWKPKALTLQTSRIRVGLYFSFFLSDRDQSTPKDPSHRVVSIDIALAVSWVSTL